MPSLTLRPYQTRDEADVIALWQACDLTRPWNNPHQDITRKLAVQADGFLVGCVNDALVDTLVASAMFGYDGHRGWVNYLAVAPKHQGLGHARALMLAGEQWLLAAGCPKLNLQIRSSNSAVFALYRHLGYAVDDVVSMGKRLIADT